MSAKDTNNNPDHIPLDDSINLSNAVVETTLANNDICGSLEAIEPYVGKSIYHCFMKAIGLLVIAASSLTKDEIDKAAKSVEQLRKLTNKYRKTGALTSFMKMIKTPSYSAKKYSDLEIHAELIHTYYLALSAVIISLESTNIYGLIKVALRLQKFMKNFKGCRKILKKRKDWESKVSQDAFESGVRFANGLQNLAISQIPPKLLRLVNVLGYKGEESLAFEEINKAAFEFTGFNARAARLFLCAYWLYGQSHIGLGPKELPKTEKMLAKELEQSPNSILILGGKAKLEEVSGRIDSAIKMFEDLLKNDYNRAHNAIYFELIFCYGLKCEWNECIKYVEKIRQQNELSPVMATFSEAVFRYVKSMDENNAEQKQMATKLMQSIPALRVRHLGKTITPEKIAVESSVKYLKNKEFLILPELEILYNGNWLTFIKGNEPLLNKLKARVEKELDRFSNDKSGADYLTALFYKGVILKLLANYSEAKQCFTAVLKDESRFGREVSIPAQAALELGLTELAENNTEEAKKWLNKCLDDYSRYLMENIVHLRAYAGLREMGISTDKQKEDEMKLEQYKKEWLKEIKVEEKNYESILKEEDETIDEKL